MRTRDYRFVDEMKERYPLHQYERAAKLMKELRSIKTPQEIEIMRQAALVVSRTLGKIAEIIGPGITANQLDALAEDYIRSQDAIPGFKGLYGCPSTLLISTNEQVVHGLPNDRPFENGDVVSVDCGAIYKGYYGDHAYTFEIGEVAPETKNSARLYHSTTPPKMNGIPLRRSVHRRGPFVGRSVCRGVWRAVAGARVGGCARVSLRFCAGSKV